MEGYTKTEVGLAKFSLLIKERHKVLQNYASLPKCNQLYLNKELAYLNELTSVYNTIEGEYDRLGNFEALSDKIDGLLKSDNQIGEIILYLNVHPTLTNPGCLSHDLCNPKL